MKELFVRLGGALVIIGALTGGTWWLINGGEPRATSSAANDADASAAATQDSERA